jgi:hypothetical protein
MRRYSIPAYYVLITVEVHGIRDDFYKFRMGVPHFVENISISESRFANANGFRIQQNLITLKADCCQVTASYQ